MKVWRSRGRPEGGTKAPGPEIGTRVTGEPRTDAMGLGDAAEMLCSLTRGYGELLEQPGADHETLIHQRPEPASWSALDHATHVRDVWTSTTDRRTRLASGTDSLVVLGVVVEAPRAGGDAAEGHTISAELAEREASLVHAIECLDAESQRRVDGNGKTGALTAVQHAVHKGAHHLHEAELALRAARSLEGTGSAMSASDRP